MNKPETKIDFYAATPVTITHQYDSVRTNTKNKASIVVDRKNIPLLITLLQTDSIPKTITIFPKNSFAYYANIFCNYGIGMLIDKNTPKRFGYPRHIYLDSSGMVSTYYNYTQQHKGEVYLHISAPYVNSFLLQPENEPDIKNNTGFLGISIGLDYYYSKNQFLNFSASAVSDLFVPVPAPVYLGDEYELMTSAYFSFSNHHKLKRFSLGYGIAYGKNIWKRSDANLEAMMPVVELKIKRSHVLGFVFPAYYQLGRSFNIGVIYRPTFLRLDIDPALAYEHLISLDLAWKIRL